MIAAGISDLMTGLGATALLIISIILAVLVVLMPYYVYKIAQRSKELADLARTLCDYSGATKLEQAKTNALLRQLIKAYGHEPEA